MHPIIASIARKRRSAYLAMLAGFGVFLAGFVWCVGVSGCLYWFWGLRACWGPLKDEICAGGF